tara:strand:+ start:1353 stop:1874 length:522 start_codon:yes stop_codon:yes gene_type:complete
MDIVHTPKRQAHLYLASPVQTADFDIDPLGVKELAELVDVLPTDPCRFLTTPHEDPRVTASSLSQAMHNPLNRQSWNIASLTERTHSLGKTAHDALRNYHLGVGKRKHEPTNTIAIFHPVVRTALLMEMGKQMDSGGERGVHEIYDDGTMLTLGTFTPYTAVQPSDSTALVPR